MLDMTIWWFEEVHVLRTECVYIEGFLAIAVAR